ncbi:hypothetical protein A0H81_11717 [Grifola frondosa]|uniref:Uncharacterized protein n=1 Tax=Grifola frondosa TaxID=5627 RepID=A0A1C7LYZ1_GRIFR|nr:hypothetical protein A0H81_11717 [Grifola frondosa]
MPTRILELWNAPWESSFFLTVLRKQHVTKQPHLTCRREPHQPEFISDRSLGLDFTGIFRLSVWIKISLN